MRGLPLSGNPVWVLPAPWELGLGVWRSSSSVSQGHVLRRGRADVMRSPRTESAHVYSVEFLEPGSVSTRPVPVDTVEFKQAVQRLARGVRWAGSPRQVAREWLEVSKPSPQDVETVEMSGEWLLESYRGQTYTFVPLSQTGPVPLTPAADEALKAKYLHWCESRGGGDCLGLLDDGPYLRTDDRRTLALALALGPVLDETRKRWDTRWMGGRWCRWWCGAWRSTGRCGWCPSRR